MRLKFWGVRGSLPIPGKETLNYGGNTSCVEIDTGRKNETIIIDAGSGIKGLGQDLMDRGFCNENGIGYLFLSHYHLDHILGFPFFAPFFAKGENKNSFTIYGPKTKNDSLKEIINHLISAPFFPLSLNRLSAVLDFKEINPGEVIELPDMNISTERLNHPGGGLAYRFDSNNISVAYVTDTEPLNENKADSMIAGLVKNADVLIYDATYTPEEYVNKKGWGHSTWRHGITLANEASVKKLVLFHHDLDYSDERLAQIEKIAKKEFKDVEMAKEGMEIKL
ncbi:MAG: MBL fold metallo-hydrolase [bacterium]|nr:MBL fold metallo-hydrolase [bacterium]